MHCLIINCACVQNWEHIVCTNYPNPLNSECVRFLHYVFFICKSFYNYLPYNAMVTLDPLIADYKGDSRQYPRRVRQDSERKVWRLRICPGTNREASSGFVYWFCAVAHLTNDGMQQILFEAVDPTKDKTNLSCFVYARISEVFKHIKVSEMV